MPAGGKKPAPLGTGSGLAVKGSARFSFRLARTKYGAAFLLPITPLAFLRPGPRQHSAPFWVLEPAERSYVIMPDLVSEVTIPCPRQ